MPFHYAHLTGQEAEKTQRQERKKRQVSKRQEGKKGYHQRERERRRQEGNTRATCKATRKGRKAA